MEVAEEVEVEGACFGDGLLQIGFIEVLLSAYFVQCFFVGIQ